MRPLSRYCLARTDLRGLIIGYGYAPLKDIELGGTVIAQAVAQALKQSKGVMAQHALPRKN